jgi:hypothetical protein
MAAIFARWRLDCETGGRRKNIMRFPHNQGLDSPPDPRDNGGTKAFEDDEEDVTPDKIRKGRATSELGAAGANLQEFGGSGADSGGTGAGATALDAIAANNSKKKRKL